MNKKILISSIASVAILILVSFTSVVGYNSIESSVKESPLFNIRSSRAIDVESKGLRREYVGKGEESILSFPQRDNKIKLIHNFIDNFQKMDDLTFNRFINLIINKLQYANEFKNVNINELIIYFNQLRNNPEFIDIDYGINNMKFTMEEPTDCWERECFTYCSSLTICWFPGCIPAYILFLITAILLLLLSPLILYFLIFTGTLNTVFCTSRFTCGGNVCEDSSD